MKKKNDVNITIDFNVTQKSYDGTVEPFTCRNWDTVEFNYQFEIQGVILKLAQTDPEIRRELQEIVSKRFDALIYSARVVGKQDTGIPG